MADDLSMGFLMNWNAKLLRRLADRRLAPLGLSSGHFPVLVSLMQHEALSQKELTEQAGIEQPTMAATLTRMERDGIVSRASDPSDKRSFRYSLTPATVEKVPAIRAAVASMNRDALADIAENQRPSFAAMLRTTIVSLERAIAAEEAKVPAKADQAIVENAIARARRKSAT